MTIISSGGDKTSFTVPTGSELDVLAGGLSTGTVIDGTEVLSGGTDSGGTIEPGGVQIVSAAGQALTDLVNAGGMQTISSGGLAQGDGVIGTQTVLAGGTTSDSIVQESPVAFGAATELVSGMAIGTTVSSGGHLVVAAGGTASGSIVSAFTQETVSSAGLAVSGSVSQSGTLAVLAGGVASSVDVLGTEILSGGTDDGSIIAGALVVSSGGVASATTVSGSAVISGGGEAIGLQIADGGSVVLDSGTALGTVVLAGGTLVVSGGTASGTMLQGTLATEQVLAGGATSATSVASGAEQLVAGGLTTGTVVLSGGAQNLTAGGALDDTVSAGGVVYDAAILGFTEAAGSTSSLLGSVSGSGLLVQYGDGTLALAGSLSGFTGSAVISGGTLALTSATAGGSAVLAFGSSAATLLIDGDAPDNTISGFNGGDVIDLAALAYASGTTLTVSGNSVVLTSGGVPETFADGATASLTIAGASGLGLAVGSDGSGGTELTAALTGVSANAGVGYEIAGEDGLWVVSEPSGTSTSFLNADATFGGFIMPALPGTVEQVGPGTLDLASTPSQYGDVSANFLIAGGTLDLTSVPAFGGGAISFVSGTTGTLQIDQLASLVYNGYNDTLPPTLGVVNQIGAAYPGDVINLTFLPFATSGLGVSATSNQVVFTSNGSPITETLSYYKIEYNPEYGYSSFTVPYALSVGNAGNYSYALQPDGTGGTDLVVLPSSGPNAGTSGVAGPPFNAVQGGGVAYDLTYYTDGTVGIQVSSTVTVSDPAVSSYILSGPGTVLFQEFSNETESYVISGGTLSLEGSAYEPTIVFAAGDTGIVEFPTGSASSATISGLAPGDAIVLNELAGLNAGLALNGDVLTFTSAGQTISSPYNDVLTIPNASTLDFNLNGDVLTVACFCHGTRILTDRGERPVEQLAIGDVVITVTGERAPIRWLGRRSYAGRFLAGRRELWPVCIRAGALGGGSPQRDLLVSPSHAMLIDGVLVPARLLVNGHSISVATGCERVDYVHIELAQHDAIWAEGAASETFIDDDSRTLFQNAAEFARLYPAAEGSPRAMSYAPRVESGYALEAIRKRLHGAQAAA